jgi:chemotaxis response regulator CheB
MQLTALVYVDRERSLLQKDGMDSDRRIQWTVVSSHREVRRKLARQAPDFLLLGGERSEELAEQLLSEDVLPASTLLYLSDGGDSTLQKLGVLHRVSFDTSLRTLSADLICALEIVQSAQKKKDLIQRVKAIKSPPVGFVCASTGGPRVVEKVLRSLEVTNQALIVLQHMGEAFVDDFIRRLKDQTQKTIEKVSTCAELLPGKVYLPEGGHHLLIHRDGGRLNLRAVKLRGYETFTPCIDLTLFSAAAHLQDNCVVTVLTGMGEDGAAGAKALKERGSVIYCQNPATCSVPSMPNAVLSNGSAQLIPNDDELAASMMEGFKNVCKAA